MRTSSTSVGSEVPALMGAAEVADYLGVSVTNLKDIKDLPAAVMKVRATRLWLVDDIKQFDRVYQERRRKRLG